MTDPTPQELEQAYELVRTMSRLIIRMDFDKVIEFIRGIEGSDPKILETVLQTLDQFKELQVVLHGALETQRANSNLDPTDPTSN